MQALKADRVALQEFSEKAEALADDFRRALVMEGIPSEKANEMTIDKTVNICRSSARSDLVKSILASTDFENPKEVIAKFITEINAEKQEKQVLAYRSNQRNVQNFRQNNNLRNFRHNNSNRPNNNFNIRPVGINNHNIFKGYQNSSSQHFRSNNTSFRNSNPNFRTNNSYNPNSQTRNVRLTENLGTPHGSSAN